MEWTLLQYNVDMAMREEKVEETKWAKRSARVRALILEADADVVNLQEMRELPDNVPVSEFLQSFYPKYKYVVAYRNPTKLAFGQAILYKPERFTVLTTTSRWFSDTPTVCSDTWNPKGFGSLLFGALLQRVCDEKIVPTSAPFWVFNVHLPLDEHSKTQTSMFMSQLVKDVMDWSDDAYNRYGPVASISSCVVSGDFNLFPDRDAKIQRENFERDFDDLGRGAVTLLSKTPCEGTFVGFEHDEFKADFKNMISRLDNVYSMGFNNTSIPILYNKTMLDPEPAEFSTRSYPSDHLPIFLRLVNL